MIKIIILAGNKDGLMPDFFLDVDPEKILLKKAKTEPSGGGKDVEEIFIAITKRLNPELVRSIQAVYQFNLTGMSSCNNNSVMLLLKSSAS